LFESLGDIGIAPVFFDSVHFSDQADDTIESATLGDGRAISGTAVRDFIAQGQVVPDWCMRTDISSWLLEMQGAGHSLFIE
jgi:ATP sulfurylase